MTDSSAKGQRPSFRRFTRERRPTLRDSIHKQKTPPPSRQQQQQSHCYWQKLQLAAAAITTLLCFSWTANPVPGLDVVSALASNSHLRFRSLLPTSLFLSSCPSPLPLALPGVCVATHFPFHDNDTRGTILVVSVRHLILHLRQQQIQRMLRGGSLRFGRLCPWCERW